MVYGRYNYTFHGVYKPTNITGGHHPVYPVLKSLESTGRELMAWPKSIKIHEVRWPIRELLPHPMRIMRPFDDGPTTIVSKKHI